MSANASPISKTMSRLPPATSAALTDFRRRLLELFPSQISRLILYGSYARGDFGSESDVDVLVIVAWNEERLPDGNYVAPIADPRWQAIINAAADTMTATGVEIAPLVVSEHRFRDGFPLVNRAKREGVVLWPNPN